MCGGPRRVLFERESDLGNVERVAAVDHPLHDEAPPVSLRLLEGPAGKVGLAVGHGEHRFPPLAPQYFELVGAGNTVSRFHVRVEAEEVESVQKYIGFDFTGKDEVKTNRVVGGHRPGAIDE